MKENSELSPFGYRIAMGVGKTDFSDDFREVLSSLRKNTDLFYEKYELLQDALKKDSVLKDPKSELTHGDEMLLNLLERAAFRMMSITQHTVDYVNDIDGIYAALRKVAMPQNPEKEISREGEGQ